MIHSQVFSMAEQLREPGIFLVGAMVRPGADLTEARDRVLATTEEVGGTAFTAEEVWQVFGATGRSIMLETWQDLPQVADEAVLIGRQGKNMITAVELAKKAGTIPWEILTRLSPRVERVYR